MARGLKFCIQEVEELCYQCSENKGADQLRGHREADLRLCFRICQKLVFSRHGSYLKDNIYRFFIKTHVVDARWNFLVKAISRSTINIGFYGEISKIIL